MEKVLRLWVFIVVAGLLFSFNTRTVEANVSTWQKGATIYPRSGTDFSSDNFHSSLSNLKSTDADYVSFVIPYYQSSFDSSDIFRGWDTPTDESLVSATKYAHSLGLKVMLKPHVDNINGGWRIYVNPNNRNLWFQNYGSILNHYADIGKQHGVEEICLGAELYSVSSANVDSTNTENWKKLISQVRQRYSGALTYSAQHTTPTEENEIQFWDSLDHIGLSAYFLIDPYNPNPSVESLKNSWNDWNNSIIKPLSQKWNKPVLFTEVGYKSVSGAHSEPGAHWRSGGVDEAEQARDYEALFSYWNNQSFMIGVHWWNWESNPDAGGSSSTDYTPQNKQAQTVMKNWFSGNTNPDPVAPQPTGSTENNPNPTATPEPINYSSITYKTTASVNPDPPVVNQSLELTTSVTPNANANDVIIDIEIYNQNNIQVYQRFFDHQNMNGNQTYNYKINWTPKSSEKYTVKIGLFTNSWVQNFFWNDNLLQFNVSQTPSSTPTPINTSTPVPTVTNTPPQQPTPTPNPSTPTPGQSAGNMQIWWPADGVQVGGQQPFKAMVENLSLGEYKIYWQVDGGQLNELSDNQADYPHKESQIDLTNWNWKGEGPYGVTFVSKDKNGNNLHQSTLNIKVAR